MSRCMIARGVALLCLVAAGVTAYGGQTCCTGDGKSRAYLHSYNIPSNGTAIEGYCPVTYFTASKAVKGRPEISSTYDGVTYHFASTVAKNAFDGDPEKYVPAFGGWCAFGMSLKDKFPVDPRNFKIVDGRLMLFLKNPNVDALELWNKGNERELVRKAAAHWNTVSQ